MEQATNRRREPWGLREEKLCFEIFVLVEKMFDLFSNIDSASSNDSVYWPLSSILSCHLTSRKMHFDLILLLVKRSKIGILEASSRHGGIFRGYSRFPPQIATTLLLTLGERARHALDAIPSLEIARIVTQVEASRSVKKDRTSSC